MQLLSGRGIIPTRGADRFDLNGKFLSYVSRFLSFFTDDILKTTADLY
jgi:hypothetical protein